MLPEEEVSLKKDLYEKMQGRWTEFMGDNVPLSHHVARKELTNNIVYLLSDMQEEVNYALDREIPPCPTWTRIVIFPRLMNVSALCNGRFFVGAMGRDKTWNELVLSFAPEVFVAAQAIRRVNTWLRPLVAPFLVRRLAKLKAKAAEMLRPQVAAAIDARKANGAGLGEKGELDGRTGDDVEGWNAVPWMLNHIDVSKASVDSLIGDVAREQLFLGK